MQKEPTTETELRPLAEILKPLIDRLRGNAAEPVHEIAAVRVIREIYRTADEREQRKE